MMSPAPTPSPVVRCEPANDLRQPVACAPPVAGVLDPESLDWLSRLREASPHRPVALSELRGLLVKAARYELSRRGGQLRGGDHADLADQSANDALVAILSKLDDFRGDSRFTTWAYKFALYEAAVNIRRLSWQGREVVLEEPEQWARIADGRAASGHDAETGELFAALGVAIRTVLTPHQREVLVAIALNDVPIDVLAERLSTTRGALYKTLHDARRKLRATLSAQGLGLSLDVDGEGR